MNIYLATSSSEGWLKHACRGDKMNIHLAESGGIWNAYFKGGGGVNNEHLLREAHSRIKANGKEEGGGSDERFLAGSEFLKG